MSNVVFKIINPFVLDRLIKDGKVKLPKKKIEPQKDKRWNLRQMTSKLFRGLEAGSSVQIIAESLKDVIGNNEASTIRNARTMVTTAENHGRLDSYNDLATQGVVMQKEWIATPDDRTRASHLKMDGQLRDLDKPFSNGCMFPADASSPRVAPEEIWQCRCSMGTKIVGFRRADGSISRIDYEPDETLHDEQIQKERGKRR